MEGFTQMRRIIILDGFGDVRLNEKRINVSEMLSEEGYDEFKNNLHRYLDEKKVLESGEIIIFEQKKHVGLLGAMKTAMELVKTPILYIAQDDLALTHALPTSGVAKTMMGCLVGRNPVRFVLLNKRPNGRAARIDSFFKSWEEGNSTITNPTVLRGSPNQSIVVDPLSIHVPLLRTMRWSDNNHFALTQDYKDFLIPKTETNKSGKMWVDSYHQGWLWHHPEDWHKYGTHILGGMSEAAYIEHLSARDPVWCNESLSL